jgi:hypothetical protein
MEESGIVTSFGLDGLRVNDESSLNSTVGHEE